MAWILTGKLVYLAHPRTGSMSAVKSLQKKHGNGVVTFDHHAMFDQLPQALLTGEEVVATTVRDPRDIFVSWWLMNPDLQQRLIARFGDNAFKAFICSYTHSAMIRGGRLFYHLPNASQVLRFESSKSKLTFHLNQTKGKGNFHSYYDLEAAALIYERFKKDFDDCGYSPVEGIEDAN